MKTCKAPSCSVRKPRDELMGPMREFCSPGCGYALATHRRYQKAARDAREYRAKERARLGKTQSGPKRSAIDALHDFIKVRDHNKPCIVHGHACPNTQFDAGHFRSAGANEELRLNTWNIHKQCSVNNRGSHNKSKWNGESTAAMYEQRLVERIGRDRVDWLKGPHASKQYRDDDYRRMARIFRRRAKHYRKLRGIN